MRSSAPGISPAKIAIATVVTITAIAEHAMTAVPDKPGAKIPEPLVGKTPTEVKVP